MLHWHRAKNFAHWPLTPAPSKSIPMAHTCTFLSTEVSCLINQAPVSFLAPSKAFATSRQHANFLCWSSPFPGVKKSGSSHQANGHKAELSPCPVPCGPCPAPSSDIIGHVHAILPACSPFNTMSPLTGDTNQIWHGILPLQTHKQKKLQP